MHVFIHLETGFEMTMFKIICGTLLLHVTVHVAVAGLINPEITRSDHGARRLAKRERKFSF